MITTMKPTKYFYTFWDTSKNEVYQYFGDPIIADSYAALMIKVNLYPFDRKTVKPYRIDVTKGDFVNKRDAQAIEFNKKDHAK